MGKLIKIIFGVALAGWASSPAGGQESPRPTEPLLREVPSEITWKIEFDYDQGEPEELLMEREENPDLADEEEPAPILNPESVTVTKNRGIRREITQWSNGKSTTKWIIGKIQISESLHSDQLIPSRQSGRLTNRVSDYSRSDFEALEWIRWDNYKGFKTVAGREVFEFRVEPGEKRQLTPRQIQEWESLRYGEDDDSDISVPEPALVAYLDAETQLPLFINDGRVVRVYSYWPSDSELNVPNRVVEVFRNLVDNGETVKLPQIAP